MSYESTIMVLQALLSMYNECLFELRGFSLVFFPEIDECESSPCGNGGTCFNLINMYECDCVPGWNETFDCNFGKIFSTASEEKFRVHFQNLH